MSPFIIQSERMSGKTRHWSQSIPK